MPQKPIEQVIAVVPEEQIAEATWLHAGPGYCVVVFDLGEHCWERHRHVFRWGAGFLIRGSRTAYITTWGNSYTAALRGGVALAIRAHAMDWRILRATIGTSCARLALASLAKKIAPASKIIERFGETIRRCQGG